MLGRAGRLNIRLIVAYAVITAKLARASMLVFLFFHRQISSPREFVTSHALTEY